MAILGPTGTVYGDRADIMAAILERPMPFPMIWSEIFTPMPVPKSTGQFGRIGMDNFTNRPGADGVTRAPLAKTKMIDVRLAEGTFSTVERSLATPYDDKRRGDLEDRFGLETAMVEILYRNIQMELESAAAGLIFNTTTFPLSGITGFTAGTLWTNTAAVPKANAATALGLLAQRGGNPLTAKGVMSYVNFLTLLGMESLLNDKRYVNTPSLLITDQNRATVAAQLGLADVLVGGAYVNTAGEGLTASLSPVWADDSFFVGNFGEANGDMYQQCLARAFYNTSFLGLGTADSYRSDDNRSDMLRYGTDIDLKITLPYMGVLVKVR